MSRERWFRKLSIAVQRIFVKEPSHDGSRLLLEFNRNKRDLVIDLVRGNQGKILHSINLLPFLAVEIPFDKIPIVADSLFITKLWDDPPISLQEERIIADETVDEPMTDRWQDPQGVSHSKAPIIQEYKHTGKGIVVAVLDTGIFPHEDLTVPGNRIIGWQDFVNYKTYPYDDHGHGTETAGIIAGNGNVSRLVTKGMAPDAWLVGVKIFDQEGKGHLSDMIAGLEWCVRSLPLYNIRVLCLSVPVIYQDRFYNDPLGRMISIAWRKGITIFAPARAQKDVGFYGLPQPLITVASLNHQQAIALNEKQITDSDFLGKDLTTLAIPDLITEGGPFGSLNLEGGYTACSGNSIAAALAAGGAALVLEKWPSFGPPHIKHLLTTRAKNLGLGKDLQGSGLLSLDILGNAKKKAAPTPSALPLNMSQILPLALKLLIQNSTSSDNNSYEFFMNLMGSLMKNWMHSSDTSH